MTGTKIVVAKNDNVPETETRSTKEGVYSGSINKARTSLDEPEESLRKFIRATPYNRLVTTEPMIVRLAVIRRLFPVP